MTSRGFTPTLMSRLLTVGGPELAIYIRFDDMAAFEKFREARAADTDFMRLSQQANSLNRRGVTVGLFAPIVQADPGGRDNARYFNRTTIRAGAGNAPEVQAALEEFVRARQGDGRPVAMTRQVLSPTGPTFIVTETFGALAEYENEYLTATPPALATVGGK